MTEDRSSESETKWLSIAEAARIQGMTPEGLLQRIKRGAIPEPFLWRASANFYRLRAEYVHWPNLAERLVAQAEQTMAELKREQEASRKA